MIGIVDLGSGNVGSLSNALSFCGHTPDICRDPREINSYEKAILPGVGAFGAFADKISHLAGRMSVLFLNQKTLFGYLRWNASSAAKCRGADVVVINTRNSKSAQHKASSKTTRRMEQR